MNEMDIANLVENDDWMMSVLREAESLGLPDWMIGAGFLRNRVWDHLHNKQVQIPYTQDIDLIYCDALHQSIEHDKTFSEDVSKRTGLHYEVINQAYTHTWHDRETPYKNSTEAISEWVETATCIAVTLKNGKPIIIAPHGIDDLVQLIIRPSPKADMLAFKKRYQDKQWLVRWPRLTVISNK